MLYRKLTTLLKRKFCVILFTISLFAITLIVYLHVGEWRQIHNNDRWQQTQIENVESTEASLNNFWTSHIKITNYSVESIKKQLIEDMAITRNFVQDWSKYSTPLVIWSDSQSYPYVLTKVHNKTNVLTQLPNCSTTLGAITVETTTSGTWAPKDCHPREHIAIIIPYRDRAFHLEKLLDVLHPMLQIQRASYQIFVAEQNGNNIFNKGILMDAAFLLALNISAFDCVIFHDVDLIPENYNNFYGCSPTSRHLSHAVDKLTYKIKYKSLVGGVLAFRTKDFLKVNGYSTFFWGWGGEDDDMANRFVVTETKISRPNKEIGRYKMKSHKKRARNVLLYALIRTGQLRFREDGLTTVKFGLILTESKPLYLRFLIDVGEAFYNSQNIDMKNFGSLSSKLKRLHYAIRDATDKLLLVSET